MAQVASILLRKQFSRVSGIGYFMSADDVKFRKPVVPGDTLLSGGRTREIKGKRWKSQLPVSGQRRGYFRSDVNVRICRSMNIHPTAVIDPEAEIGSDVVIGPDRVIGVEVTIGACRWLQNHVIVCGPVKVGAGNRFHAFCSIGQQTPDLKYQGEPRYWEIGDENCFREFVTVNRARAVGSITRVGNRGNFLSYSHIAHDCVVEDDVIFSNNGTLAGHVLVQEYAIIGGLTAIHQFCRMGKHTITGGSANRSRCASSMIADGNPAVVRGINVVGLERRDIPPEIIRILKESYRIVNRSNLNTKQAVEELDNNFPGVVEVRELTSLSKRIREGLYGSRVYFCFPHDRPRPLSVAGKSATTVSEGSSLCP